MILYDFFTFSKKKQKPTFELKNQVPAASRKTPGFCKP